MNAEHVLARRDIRRQEGKEPANMGAEAALLALCLVSGLAGVYFENVTLMCTIFAGGMVTWILLGLPAAIENFKSRIVAESEKRTKTKSGAVDKPVGIALPPADQVLKLIQTRRSIFPRDYTGAKVPREQIEQLLEAANWAPTHQLTQPWRFTVLEGEGKARFEDLTIQCVGKYTEPADKAAAAVERIQGKAKKTWPLVSHYVVISMARVPAKSGKMLPEWEDLAAVASAVQNMQLLATAQGVACYWSSWQVAARDAPEMADFLGLNTAAGDKCLGVLSLGVSERADSYRGSRSPAMDKVKWIS